MGKPVPWRDAWESALYGPGGFYTAGARPAAHFRTSAHASPLFAGVVLTLIRESGLDTVVDVGAGGGELLRDLHAVAPDLQLCGVDVGPRPVGLPSTVDWTDAVPNFAGLLLANEWLDNIACHVVEGAHDGPRLVCVDATGRESLGDEPDPADTKWLERWWPLHEPGQRAEIGRSRDEAWSTAVSHLDHGLAIAIDYAHSRNDRPSHGTLAGYRAGRQVPPVPDGSCDITAHVALDSCAVAAAGESVVLIQRAALRALGLRRELPNRSLAAADPNAYVRALQASSDAGELIAAGGLGDFTWLVHAVGQAIPAALSSARAGTSDPG